MNTKTSLSPTCLPDEMCASFQDFGERIHTTPCFELLSSQNYMRNLGNVEVDFEGVNVTGGMVRCESWEYFEGFECIETRSILGLPSKHYRYKI